MPAPSATLVRPESATITVSMEPVYSALNSLMLIAKSEHLSGLGEWIAATRAALTKAELDNHRMVMEGLHFALYPKQQWPSFPAYLDHLEEMDAIALRDRLLAAYFELPCAREEPSPYKSYEDILRSPESYVEFLTGRFGADHVDPEVERQAYTYVINPSAMKLLIVSHLRMMWDRYLAAEWRRVEPMLKDSVKAFSEIDFSQLSRREAIEFVTGRSLKHADWVDEHPEATIVLAPSAHIGPYHGIYDWKDQLIMIFGARLPQGTTMTAPDLSRNEIVVRLNALADDTRLRILHFIAQHGEQRSQEIMSELDLSQSAASRHLKQLSATGYLVERRCEGAKCYSLDEERLRDTMHAVLAFLAVTP